MGFMSDGELANNSIHTVSVPHNLFGTVIITGILLYVCVGSKCFARVLAAHGQRQQGVMATAVRRQGVADLCSGLRGQ